MKQVIKELIAAGIATFAMFYAVVYCATEPGIKGWIYFALFLVVFSYLAATFSGRREKVRRAKMRKVVWNR